MQPLDRREAGSFRLLDFARGVKTPTFAHFCYYLIFHMGTGQSIINTDGKRYVVSTTAGGLRKIDTEHYLFIEQNKNKGSKWADLALSGRNIMWVIRKKDNKWICRVMDGNLETL